MISGWQIWTSGRHSQTQLYICNPLPTVLSGNLRAVGSMMVDDILCYSVEIVRIQISPPLKVTPIFEGLLRNTKWADFVT